ncbi:MAG: DUF4422 domain-containing protein [Lachnospiraceae bacterium]|nr:DUF4422 domain-containing protein [Lachnospiraceae bacterium]
MIVISKSVYIFGAHTRAQNLYAYFKILFPETKVEAFLYDNEESNPESIEGIPVLRLQELGELQNETEVWLAVKSVAFDEISNRLTERKAGNIVCVTPQVDNELRNLYVEKIFSAKGMGFDKVDRLWASTLGGQEDFQKFLALNGDNMKKSVGDAIDSLPVVYMAKSVYDKPIRESFSASYIETVQAGAALTEERIAELTDCMGENISRKNRQYCELTVLYWMWKNATASWVGLCHYRRHFILTEEEMAWLPESGIDVVLPVPSICQPSIGDNYRKRHEAKDWEYLLNVLKEKYPEMYDLAVSLWETPEFGNLYYTCNMFIMKKQVMDVYCAWLFPILEEVERFAGEKEDTYQNRYPGFLAERLLTLYFVYYKDKYKIAYADKRFIMGD